jgi:hypothetical protein
MEMGQGVAKMEVKEKLSTLWIVVMFNMAFADILSFMIEFSNGLTAEVQATQAMMLIAAFILEIPIIMIIFSRVLKYRVNRWVNIIASIITILFVIGGGSFYLHYLFFASVEVVCLLLILWFACRWQPNPRN